jgi:hypothetical protein
MAWQMPMDFTFISPVMLIVLRALVVWYIELCTQGGLASNMKHSIISEVLLHQLHIALKTGILV